MEVLVNNIAAAVDSRAARAQTKIEAWPFYLVLLYLFLEFGRPQDSVPGLAVLRLPMLVTICLIAALVRDAGSTRFAHGPTRLFGCFVVLMAFHIPFAVNNYWAFYTVRTMSLTFAAYLGIVRFVDSYVRFKVLISVWLGIHVYLAISGLWSGGVGVGGFLADENDFGLTLNMVLPYAYFLTFADVKSKDKIIHYGLVILFMAAIVATFSRGGFLGLLAVGMYMWLRSPRKMASACGIAMLGLLLIGFAPKAYWDEMETIQKEFSGELLSTGAGREYEWQIGWRMFLDNPILGVGPNNFAYRFKEYEGEDSWEGRSLAGRQAHSLYYTLMPELGLLGVLLFLGMNYRVYKDLGFVRRLYKGRRRVAKDEEARLFFYAACALEASLIGYLVSGCFVSVLYYPNLWILMAFATVLRRVATLSKEASAATFPGSRAVNAPSIRPMFANRLPN